MNTRRSNHRSLDSGIGARPAISHPVFSPMRAPMRRALSRHACFPSREVTPTGEISVNFCYLAIARNRQDHARMNCFRDAK
jgi:hypothetical protein